MKTLPCPQCEGTGTDPLNISPAPCNYCEGGGEIAKDEWFDALLLLGVGSLRLLFPALIAGLIVSTVVTVAHRSGLATFVSVPVAGWVAFGLVIALDCVAIISGFYARRMTS